MSSEQIWIEHNIHITGHGFVLICLVLFLQHMSSLEMSLVIGVFFLRKKKNELPWYKKCWADCTFITFYVEIQWLCKSQIALKYFTFFFSITGTLWLCVSSTCQTNNNILKKKKMLNNWITNFRFGFYRWWIGEKIHPQMTIDYVLKYSCIPFALTNQNLNCANIKYDAT